jgi:hypothetical protein
MACACPPHPLHGGSPVAISSTTHPSDQMSASAPTSLCRRTTSGAIQNALPATPALPPLAPRSGLPIGRDAFEAVSISVSVSVSVAFLSDVGAPARLSRLPDAETRSTRVLAMPKSASLTLPLFSTRMFAPLTSLCATRCACR